MQEQQWLTPCTSEYRTQKTYETNLRPGARSTGAVVEVADSNTLMTLHRMQNVIRL